ncbi:MAG: hypothetical protein VB024_09555 [Dysgonamonadaceae bacterium]|jgi:hypothetical protein|nr:hypothetical protein [Dysgonamonadaceae bacterium]MDD3308494.1 hypothetical protein [Dysgonamonadaceae bacterium]MDD3899644.1 hypothetical protein [Dysgonamonadaceae bacterium]MDD4398157.1 hypothetical protein [Dysgonamonadaceae bacterium]MEA5081854.1 hypothetical protein [Dysgonamonadaceae bacterium]
MKTKLFLILALFIGSCSIANAQFVNEVPLSQLDADYVRIWADNGPVLSSKVTVRIDYGQSGRIPQITDERRRALSFNGMMAVLNMMSKQGFELIEVVRDSKDEMEMFYLKRKDSSIPYAQPYPAKNTDFNETEQDK